MRFVRYQTENKAPHYGWLLEDKIGDIDGDLFGEFRRLDATLPREEATLLAPCEPSKIICVGRNYAAHAKEHNAAVPEIPLIFLKPPSAILNPEDEIVLPPQSRQVEHEGELVVVIGKRGRNILTEDAKEHILGYTIGNDVTARDLQRADRLWTRGKGFDTFAPFGPWIDTDFDPSDAVLTCRVNGQMRQMASTRDMVFSVGTIIAFISSVMTLEPGDLIFTGTPAGVGALTAGDEVTVDIEGLGLLKNTVKNA